MRHIKVSDTESSNLVIIIEMDEYVKFAHLYQDLTINPNYISDEKQFSF